MFIGSTIALFQQLSGENVILSYAPTLFKTLGFASNSASTLATVSVGTTKFIFSIITFFTIDRLGRRPLLLIGISLLSASMLLLGSLSVIFIDTHLVLSNSSTTQLSNCNNTTLSLGYVISSNMSGSELNSISVTKWISLVLFMTYIAGFQISYGAVAWLILTEMFPPSVRGQAVSLASTVNRIFNIIGSSIFLSIYNALFGYTYIMYGCFSMFALIFVFLMVPETKGKSLEKISKEFRERNCMNLTCNNLS